MSAHLEHSTHGAERGIHVLRPGAEAADPLPGERLSAPDGADVLVASGLVLSTVATIHFALIWTPAHFGVVPWEFAAATQSIDLFPLAATGAALLGWAAVSRGWRRRAAALAAWCGLCSLLLLASAGLIVLDLPVAWNSVTPEMREGLLETAGKALSLGVVFTAFFLWLVVRLGRAIRSPTAIRS